MHLTVYLYELYYTFVLGNCTQVHLQCTWVVPKYISQNPVLVLVLEYIFNVLVLVSKYRVDVLAQVWSIIIMISLCIFSGADSVE